MRHNQKFNKIFFAAAVYNCFKNPGSIYLNPSNY